MDMTPDEAQQAMAMAKYDTDGGGVFWTSLDEIEGSRSLCTRTHHCSAAVEVLP
jgi:hypothetical protein